MDPFNLLGWILALILILFILTPAVKLFNFSLRSMIKSTKKTAKTIHS